MDALTRVIAAVLRSRWVPLPVGPGDEFEGVPPIYWVSSDAEVLYVAPAARPGRRCGFKTARLEIRPRRRPHTRVNLKLPGHRKFRTARLHRVVLAAFHLRPEPEGRLGLHRDGNPTNNRLSNLRYGTAAENLTDAYTHGSRAWGRPCAGCTAVCPWCDSPKD